ncbi:hypothetical protein CIB48_g4809 [Xylaria polymorpha]|nr:hypothetical protein CIB48_g4809 [Xylaria polymorpha]
MSSSGRTPLPVRRPLPTINPNMGVGPNRTKERPLLRNRPAPVEEKDIDRTKSPAVRSADGVILTNGKFRCNICGNKMKNEAASIRSHNSKLHPKDPNKPSAYLRRLARNPTPCLECGKMCNSIEMLTKHARSKHRRAQQPA